MPMHSWWYQQSHVSQHTLGFPVHLQAWLQMAHGNFSLLGPGFGSISASSREHMYSKTRLLRHTGPLVLPMCSFMLVMNCVCRLMAGLSCTSKGIVEGMFPVWHGNLVILQIRRTDAIIKGQNKCLNMITIRDENSDDQADCLHLTARNHGKNKMADFLASIDTTMRSLKMMWMDNIGLTNLTKMLRQHL